MTERPIMFSAPMVNAILGGLKTQTRRLVAPNQCEWGSYGRVMWEAGDFDRAYPDRGFPDGSGLYRAGYMHVPVRDDHPKVVENGMEQTRHRLYPRIACGDRLWVREAIRAEELDDGRDGVRFAADSTWLPIVNLPEASEAWSALYHYRGRGRARIGKPVPPIHMPRWCARLVLTVEAVRIERLHDLTEDDARAEGVRREGWEYENGECCDTAREAFSQLWNHLHGPDAWEANPWVVVIRFATEPVAGVLGSTLKENG